MSQGTRAIDGQVMGLYEAIERRRDVRGEFTGAPIAAASLDRVLRAAHSAPSVGLSQPWDFVIIEDRDLRERFHEHVQAEREVFAVSLPSALVERFADIKIEGILESTMSIVVTYDPDRGAPSVLGRHAIADAGLYSVCLAIENLWLAATAEDARRAARRVVGDNDREGRLKDPLDLDVTEPFGLGGRQRVGEHRPLGLHVLVEEGPDRPVLDNHEVPGLGEPDARRRMGGL